MRTVGRLARFCVVGAIALSSGSATAQDEVETDAEAEAEDDSQYQGLLEEAVSEYNAGRYAEARALFLRAHELEPSARTLRGVGMAAFEMREYVEALRSLEAALAFEERPLTEDQRAHVEGLIRRTVAFVGRYRVELSPESAELFVDDAPVDLEEDRVVLLNLGRHTFEARCPGCSTVRRQVRVHGGENETLTFDLQLEEEEVPAETTGATQMTASIGTDQPNRRDRRSGATGTVLLIGSAVLAAGAAGGVIWWLDRNSELDRCQNAGDACRNEETLALERGTAITVTIGLGLAAVGSLVGGLVLLGDGDDETVTLGCAPGLSGVGCVGTF